MPSLCAPFPVQSATHQPPCGQGNTWSPAARTPVAPRSSQIHTFLAPNKMKERKKEFFLSLVFFFQTSVHSILRLPDPILNSSERTLVFVLGCESAFRVSPSHTRAQTELPLHPELSLPRVLLLACLSSSFLSSWVGIAKSELLVGFNPHRLCVPMGGAAFPGLISSLLLHDRDVSINTFISKYIYGVESSFSYREPLLP